VTLVDWIALAIVLLAAVAGLQRGLIVSAFSLVGLAGGAYAGSQIAPYLLSGGASSRWTAAAGFIGAVLGAALLQMGALFAASVVRGGLRLAPLRLLDSAGGLVLGAAAGLAIVWVGAAVAQELSRGQTRLSGDLHRSWIVRHLDSAFPPRSLLNLLVRIDPFPSIATGPAAPTLPPSTGVLRNHAIRASLTRVVKVLGTACGAGVEGSGWFAGRDLVVTAAHVVAGEGNGATSVQLPGESFARAATVVLFDPHNDVAVLLVAGVDERPLAFAAPRDGASAVIAGYPLDGNLSATPGRVGRTATVLTQDALGRGPVDRTITAVAGRVEHGNSGGPVIDAAGAVEGEIFAARTGHGPASGYAVPSSIVRADLAHAGRRAVSTDGCAP
jgi:S1-C subfamily serine protease